MPAPHELLIELATAEELPPGRRVTPAVAASATEHGLAPLLDEQVRASGTDGDHDALVALAMQSLETVAETESAFDAIRSLLDTADMFGIEAAVFKGLAIGTRWYPRPDLRPAVDVDVFVNPDQADRLGEFIEHLTGRSQSRVAIEEMVAEGRVFEYSLLVKGVSVDLHIDPMNQVVLTRQRDLVWQRTETFDLADGRPARTLDLESSIIQALLHLFRDNFADLPHAYDIKLMIEDDPDWEFITAYAESEGFTDLIRYSLGTVCDVFTIASPLPRDLTLPGRVLIPLVWPKRLLLKGNDSVARSYRRQSLASLLITGRRLDVTRALTRRVFPPRSVIDDRFPGCACPYPVALLRWRLSQRAENKKSHEVDRTIHAPI